MCDLKSGLIELAIAKLLERVAYLPFVNALSALDEVVEALANDELGASIFEELHVKRFFQVLLRPLHHALAAPVKLHNRHFFSSDSCYSPRWEAFKVGETKTKTLTAPGMMNKKNRLGSRAQNWWALLIGFIISSQ